MTRLLLVCHAGIAEAMWDVARTILTSVEAPRIVAVATQDDPEQVLERIALEIRRSPPADPPLILADLPGATPHNLALRAVERECPAASVLAGVNLPMLLRALMHRDLAARELAQRVAEGGREAIFAGPGR